VAPRDRAAWRAWLAAHHASAREVVVVFHRKGTGTSVSYDDAVEEALCFGWIDGVRHKLDDVRYTNRFTPRTPKSAWSAPNRRRAAAMIAAGLMQPAGQAAIDAAVRAGTWDRPAATATGPAPAAPPAPSAGEPPAELAAALAHPGASAARRAFDALAPGQRRLWMRWVGSARHAETRARRAAKAVEQLRAGHKVPQGA
jgi:uncharacterized protein YdeI (YjbR/CyaY-like superfamily)